MEKSSHRFCKPLPHYRYSRGLVGLEFSCSLYSKGCGGFQHDTFRYLSPQEPLVDGIRAVAMTSSDWECDVESEYEVEDTNDPHAAANGYDLTQETIPPKHSFPITNIFTVLQVLEDAQTWHCCCCLEEPATSSP
jgi:hypothetical protein